MTHWEHIDTQDRGEFTIHTYMAPEEDSPMGHFDDGEVIEGIMSGLYSWFQVKVVATKCGIELAEEYMGGCCYESGHDFIDCNDYWSDMVDEAIRRANGVILELSK